MPERIVTGVGHVPFRASDSGRRADWLAIGPAEAGHQTSRRITTINAEFAANCFQVAACVLSGLCVDRRVSDRRALE
jgi:hypothetical protein